MGLDIVAVRQAVYVGGLEDFTADELDKMENLVEVLGCDFPERLDGMREGFYRHNPQDIFKFRVGAYHYYNWWRDKIAYLIYGKSAQQFWLNMSSMKASHFLN